MEDVMKLLARRAVWPSLPLFSLLVLIYFNLKNSLPSSTSVLEKPMYNILTSEIYTLMTASTIMYTYSFLYFPLQAFTFLRAGIMP
jgi:hypothetical protein